MERIPHWLTDAGHGWLVVSLAAVIHSGAHITHFSYISPDGELAYLEEDLDARAFLAATGIEKSTAATWPVKRVIRAGCRGYPAFRSRDVNQVPAAQIDWSALPRFRDPQR